MIQVEDVQCKFESLGELERNGWKPPQMERKGGKKRGKASVLAALIHSLYSRLVYLHVHVHVYTQLTFTLH